MKRQPTLTQRENGIWYISFGRNKLKSTGTKVKAEAQRILNAVKAGRLSMDSEARISTPLLSEFKDEYISSREGAKADKTLKADETALTRFVVTVGDIRVGEVSGATIDAFIGVCTQDGLKPGSINTYLRHIKTFLGQAHKQKYLKDKIEIKEIKKGKRLPKFLSDEERDRILAYAKAHNPIMWRVMMFGLYTGMRLNEIDNLDYNQVVDGEFLKFVGKGDKERIIPLLPQAAEVMGSPFPRSGKVFKCSYDYKTKQFTKIARTCGVDATFHSLRHTAATYMVANEIDLLYVKEILGHADLSTTLIYSHVLQAKLKTEMHKLKY